MRLDDRPPRIKKVSLLSGARGDGPKEGEGRRRSFAPKCMDAWRREAPIDRLTHTADCTTSNQQTGAASMESCNQWNGKEAAGDGQRTAAGAAAGTRRGVRIWQHVPRMFGMDSGPIGVRLVKALMHAEQLLAHGASGDPCFFFTIKQCLGCLVPFARPSRVVSRVEYFSPLLHVKPITHQWPQPPTHS